MEKSYFFNKVIPHIKIINNTLGDFSTKNMPIMSGAWEWTRKARPHFAMCCLVFFNRYKMYSLLGNNSQHILCNEIQYFVNDFKRYMF